MKKLARALALALCLLSLASCAQAPQPDPIPPPLEDASFNPDSEGLIRLTAQNARFLGRAFHNSRADEWGVSWTDSGFEIRFVGREVRALLTPQCLSSSQFAYAEVLIDGQEQGEKIKLTDGEKWVTLCQNLSFGEHTLRFVKLTEAQMNVVYVGPLEIPDGYLLTPPAARARSIEFIGDSITAGSANARAAGEADVYSPETQDGLQTYAAVAARALNADFSVFAASGWTVYCRTDIPDGDQVAIPPIYESTDFFHRNTDPWDFAAHPVDAVVVNLGTNDASYIAAGAFEEEIFREKYEAFLARLRELYPNAVLIGTVGMMNDTAYPAIEQAVKNRSAAGDSRVFAYKLEWAGSTHPILSKHKKAGEDLAAFLAEKLGW